MYNLLKPKVIVLLNLSRDQLHRTGEVRKVANLWHHAFTRDDVTIVVDRDDPFLEYAVANAGHVVRVTFGGRKHPDAATCPNCSAIINWSTGDYVCDCGLGSELPQIRANKRLTGPGRNAILAIEAARLMGAIVPVQLQEELTANPPDRTSVFSSNGRNVLTRLAKNPESWRVGLQSLSAPQIIFALNARGIDGRDTSWLWDIDYSSLLGKKVICIGERKLDIAYRLSVQGINVEVADSFAMAVESFGESEIEAIASYTAFQDLAAAKLGLVGRTGVDR
jgi:UDP-N-acetylmuramyl tripeptide synthase